MNYPSWLQHFLDSRVAIKISKKVEANYIERLKRLHEDTRITMQYSSVQDALQDFANRTGLTTLEVRALNRRAVVKLATDFVERDRKTDQRNLAINPNLVDHGIGFAPDDPKLEEKKKVVKEKAIKNKSHQMQHAPIENEQVEEVFHSGIAKTVERKVIEAVDMFEGAEEVSEEPKKEPESPLITRKPRRKQKDKIPSSSKLQRLRRELSRLESRLQSEYKDNNGDWKKLQPVQIQSRQELLDEINLTKKEINRQSDIAKDQLVDRQISMARQKNNAEFLSVYEVMAQQMSTQQAFDQAVLKVSTNLLRDQSQLRDEQGDKVKCVICQWISPIDPSKLPVSHLRKHESELLEYYIISGAEEPEVYEEALVMAYTKMYPFASFESRERELASVVRQVNPEAIIWTSAERNIERTDDYMISWIMSVFEDYETGLNKTVAKEALGKIKDKLGVKQDSEIGVIDTQEKFSFTDYEQSVSEVLGRYVEEYQYEDPFRRPWYTGISRQKTRFKEMPTSSVQVTTDEAISYALKKRDPEKELSPAEVEKARREIKRQLNQVKIEWKCWNCQTENTKYSNGTPKAINSLTCIYCNAYREKSVTSIQPELVGHKKVEKTVSYWICPDCGEKRFQVIRDLRGGHGPEVYECYCDEEYIDGGSFANGTSVYVFSVEPPAEYFEDADLLNRLYTEEQVEQSELNVGDRVHHNHFGKGTLVLMTPGYNYVVFDTYSSLDKPVSENLKGEVIGYDGEWRVVKSIEKTSFPVMRVGPGGKKEVVMTEFGPKMRPPVWVLEFEGDDNKYFEKPDAFLQVQVPTKISTQQDYLRKAYRDMTLRKLYRQAKLRKAKKKCKGHISFRVDRYAPEKPKKEPSGLITRR